MSRSLTDSGGARGGEHQKRRRGQGWCGSIVVLGPDVCGGLLEACAGRFEGRVDDRDEFVEERRVVRLWWRGWREAERVA
jgi:hypothetical protein